MPWEPNQLEKLKQFVAWALARIADSILSAVVQCVVAYLISLFELTWLDQLLSTLPGWFAMTILTSIIGYICVSTTKNFVDTRLRIRKELKKLAEESDSS